MHKKKIILSIALLLLIASVFIVKEAIENRAINNKVPVSSSEQPVINADDLPVITVENVSAKPGDNVQVAVQLENNPGILGMTLTVYYDESKCSLISAESGEAVKDVLDFTTSNNLGNGARFVWDGVEISEETIKDGKILLMNFKLHEFEGSCPITLKYFDGDIVDNNLLSVCPTIKNGSITIKSN